MAYKDSASNKATGDSLYNHRFELIQCQPPSWPIEYAKHFFISRPFFRPSSFSLQQYRSSPGRFLSNFNT